MKFVKRMLPNGRVEFSRTFYVVFSLVLIAAAVACLGLVVTALSRLLA